MSDTPAGRAGVQRERPDVETVRSGLPARRRRVPSSGAGNGTPGTAAGCRLFNHLDLWGAWFAGDQRRRDLIAWAATTQMPPSQPLVAIKRRILMQKRRSVGGTTKTRRTRRKAVR